VVEDVLEVENVRCVADVEELWGDLLMGVRRLVVGNPESKSLVLRQRVEDTMSVSNGLMVEVGVLGSEENVGSEIPE